MSTPRHRAIRRLLAEHDVATQADLVDLLAEEEMPVTQATVSRDLKEIGATKERSADGSWHYRVNDTQAPAGNGELARAFDDYVVRVTPTGSLVVVVTLPGAAQVVARTIDEADVDGVVGTIAGDDTVLVVGGPEVDGVEVADRLETGGGTV